MTNVLVHGDCYGVLVTCSCGETLLQGQDLSAQELAEAEQNHAMFCAGSDVKNCRCEEFGSDQREHVNGQCIPRYIVGS